MWSCLVSRMDDNIMIGNKYFKSVEYSQYLETTLTKQNCNYEEIKSSLITGNDCLHSVRNFCLPVCYTKNINIEIYRTIILPFLCGCETWPVALREERKQSV
jgi:hypothetical protein